MKLLEKKLKNINIVLFILIAITLLLWCFLINFDYVFADDEYVIEYIFNDDIYTEYKSVDVPYTLLGEIYFKEGYTQDGWSLDESAFVKDYDLNEIIINNDNLTLYPYFIENEYVINVYDFDSTKISEINITYGEQYSINVELKTGYTFISYFTEENGQGIQITNEFGESLTNYNFTSDINAYPYYETNTYSIIYNQVDDFTSKDVVFGSSYILDIPVIDGMVFKGWYSDINGQGIQITNEFGESLTNYNNTSHLNVYPYYEEISIELNVNNFVFVKKDNIDTFTIEYNVYPENSSEVTFISTNEDVATVTQNGIVKCVGIGNASIIAQLKNGGKFVKCEIQSVDIKLGQGNIFVKVKVNNKEEYNCLIDSTLRVEDLAINIQNYIGVKNNYIVRNDNGIEINNHDNLKNNIFNNKLNINFIYDIEKNIGNTSFTIQSTAECGQIVQLKNINSINNCEAGKIQVVPKNNDEGDVDNIVIYQGQESFIMPNYNVQVSVLVKDITLKAVGVGDFNISSEKGIDTLALIKLSTTNTYSTLFDIPENKYVVLSYKIEMKIGNEEVQPNAEYVISFRIPEELYGKDGIEVLILNGEEMEYKQAIIENGMVSFNAKSMGEFVFIANEHEMDVDLSWLVILFAFLDTVLLALDIILFVRYYELKQKKKGFKMNTWITPIFILGAVMHVGILSAAICLIILFVVELIFTIWLLHKLTNEKYLRYNEDLKNTYGYKID